ncbi:MAG: GLPGLI family protein [Bacteroidales bacterium]|nr:GLPGLI family protein [Bacteroidales bacterium]
MKKTTLILSLAIISFIAFSQNGFKAEYKLILAKNGYAPMYYELSNSGGKSVFKFIKKDNPERFVDDYETGDLYINPETPDSIQPLIITNFAQNKIISIEYLTDDDGTTYKKYIVSEPITIEWKLVNETKQIDKYLCNKAITKFRGREYIVWYSKDIPVSIGPWKFHRLPGLIVEVIDLTNEVSMNLINIKYPYNEDIKTKMPGLKNTITIDNFFELKYQAKNKSREAFISKVTSKLPRGATIELTEEGSNDIEKSL